MSKRVAYTNHITMKPLGPQRFEVCKEDSYPYLAVQGTCHQTNCSASLAKVGALGWPMVQPETSIVWFIYPHGWLGFYIREVLFLKLTARTWKWMVVKWSVPVGVWPIFRGEVLISGPGSVIWGWPTMRWRFARLVAYSTYHVTGFVRCCANLFVCVCWPMHVM